MKMNNQKLSLAMAMIITLVFVASIKADDNPFSLLTSSKITHTNEKLACGMCGNGMKGKCSDGMCRSSMKGNWGGNMGGNMPDGISPEMLPSPDSEGAKVLTKTCTQCHGLPAPGLHTAQEWPSVVKRMQTHMRWSSRWMKIDIPTEKELSVVIDYLQNHSQVPIDTAAYSELNSSDGKTFSQTCSQCHVLPEPKQHTADEWPVVIDRMLTHIATSKKPMPEKNEIEKITKFLQKHSK